MLDKLIVFLWWIWSNTILRKWLDIVFSIVTLIGIGWTIYLILWEIFPINYQTFSNLIGKIPINLIFIFLVGSLLLVYWISVFRWIRERDFSVLRISVNYTLPILVGLVLIILYSTEDSYVEWYILVFGWLYAASPYISILGWTPKLESGVYRSISESYKKYNLSFIIWFLIFLGLYICEYIIRPMDYIESMIFYFVVIFIPYILITWIIITYSWETIEHKKQTTWKNIVRGGILLSLIFIFLWLSSESTAPEYVNFW